MEFPTLIMQLIKCETDNIIDGNVLYNIFLPYLISLKIHELNAIWLCLNNSDVNSSYHSF